MRYIKTADIKKIGDFAELRAAHAQLKFFGYRAQPEATEVGCDQFSRTIASRYSLCRFPSLGRRSRATAKLGMPRVPYEHQGGQPGQLQRRRRSDDLRAAPSESFVSFREPARIGMCQQDRGGDVLALYLVDELADQVRNERMRA